jgi:hypothetical protein
LFVETIRPRHMDVKTAGERPTSLPGLQPSNTAPPSSDTTPTPPNSPYQPHFSLAHHRPSHTDSPTCRSSTQTPPTNKPPPRRAPADNNPNRVRTLTGKEIELDIESDYKVRHDQSTQRAKRGATTPWHQSPREPPHRASKASLFRTSQTGLLT